MRLKKVFCTTKPVAFRLAAFASWDIMYPLEGSALVTPRLPDHDGMSRTLLGLPRFARGEDTVALEYLN